MSGGSFDYKCFEVTYFSDELKRKIQYNNVPKYGWCPNYSDETIKKLEECARIISLVGELAHDIEWLYSGDIGEETFVKNCDEIMSKLYGGKNDTA